MSETESLDQLLKHDNIDGGAKRKKKKSKSRKRTKRKKSKKRSKSPKRGGDLKYYTILDSRGRELGGRYSGYSPAQAARKLQARFFSSGNTVRVSLRQMTPGPTHNLLYVYRIKRQRVPASIYIKKLTGNNYMYNKTVTPIEIKSYDDEQKM
jgi:hypothetical protein